MITFADVILNSKEYNGHKEFHLDATVKLSDAKSAVKELQDKFDTGDWGGTCTTMIVLEIYADDSASIVAKDYWEKDEHNLGHRDKLLCSITRVM